MATSTTIARGQITIVDLNDAKQISAYLQPSSQAQIYNPDVGSSGQYTPNFTSSNPLVVTPKVYVTGNPSSVLSSCSGIKFTVNGTSVTPGNTSGDYSVTAEGILNIKGNAPSNSSGFSIDFEASYTDADVTGGQPMKVEAHCVVVLSKSSGSALTAYVNYPHGYIFDSGAGSTTPSTLTAVVTCFRGGTQDLDFTATWQKLTGTTWTNVDNSKVVKDNTNGTSTLSVTAEDVLNHQIFRCTVSDSTPNSATAVVLCSFEDKTDPYEVVVGSTTGDKIVNGQGSTTIFARVWQGGEQIETESTAIDSRKFVYTWHKFDKDGDPSNFNGTSSPTKTGNPLTVAAADVNTRATFVCELSKKS